MGGDDGHGADDEYLEVTPKSLRMRKRLLKEADRRRAIREKQKIETQS